MDNPEKEASKGTTNKPHVPGEGIRSLKTSNVFRVVNFELYTKPSKPIMVVGVLGITFCIGYLTYLNYHYDRSQYYEAYQEDGTKVLQPKKSRWE